MAEREERTATDKRTAMSEYELMEPVVLRGTVEAVQRHGVAALPVDDLTEADLALIPWSGGPLHPKAVAKALERRGKGEIDYLAVRAPNGWPVSIGGIDYAANAGAGTLWQLSTHSGLRGLGLGTRLITESERRIKDRGLEWARLGVEDNNEDAKRLYARLGYETYGHEQQSWEEVNEKGETDTHHAEVTLMQKRLTN